MENNKVKFADDLNLKNTLDCDFMKELFKNKYGFEREMLRVEGQEIASTNHPKIFGDKGTHPYITTDYAEAQLEVITNVHCCSLRDAILFNDGLYNLCANALESEEYCWPLSLPPKFQEDKVQEANYDANDENKRSYRLYLTKKYGKKKQLISGVHFNFSFNEGVLEKIRTKTQSSLSEKEFRNRVYLKLVNNYQYYRYLVTLFLSASPIADKSLDVENCFAIRSGKNGHRNQEELAIDYSTIENYKKSIQQLLENQTIFKENEIYKSIRLKTGHKNVVETIDQEGIRYIEVRNIDVNPYYYGGIDLEAMKFVEMILLYCTFGELQNGIDLQDEVANTQDPYQFEGVVRKDIEEMISFFEGFGKDTTILKKYLNDFMNHNLLGTRVKQEIESQGYLEFGESLGKRYKKESLKNRVGFVGFNEMELSTQILLGEAITQGIKVRILDVEANFIQLERGDKQELIRQATKTRLDHYVNVEMMGNKAVTNLFLAEKGIRVPKGKSFTDKEEALHYALGLSFVVIKPVSTNFGVGIHIFKEKAEKEVLLHAIEDAFRYDQKILVEEFVEGKEYRFLVINNQVEGVLERVPANVIGDGIHTIAQLIDQKNEDPLRGVGYKTPLEKIKVDDILLETLKEKNLTIKSIPEKGKTIFLRKNSNISTGGDSLDKTEEVHPFYKELAIQAVKAMGVQICGVDIISNDFSKETKDYAILELNYNPAIHIHCYPYIGKERNIAKIILKTLEI